MVSSQANAADRRGPAEAEHSPRADVPRHAHGRVHKAPTSDNVPYQPGGHYADPSSVHPGTPHTGCCPALFVSKSSKAHCSLQGPKSSGGVRDTNFVIRVMFSCFQSDSTSCGSSPARSFSSNSSAGMQWATAHGLSSTSWSHKTRSSAHGARACWLQAATVVTPYSGAYEAGCTARRHRRCHHRLRSSSRCRATRRGGRRRPQARRRRRT